MNEKVVSISVKPIDRSAKGGFRLHQQVRNFILRAQQAQKSGDAIASLETDQEIEDWVISRLSVPEGKSLDDELDELSYDQYLELFKAALGGTSIDPLTNASSSAPAAAETSSLPGS